jgi:hypothetical protein
MVLCLQQAKRFELAQGKCSYPELQSQPLHLDHVCFPFAELGQATTGNLWRNYSLPLQSQGFQSINQECYPKET